MPRHCPIFGFSLIWTLILYPQSAWGRVPSEADSARVVQGRVHLTVGANGAAVVDPIATVRGGVTLWDIAELAHRPLRVRAMVELDVFRQETGVPFPRSGFTGPGVVLVSSTNGLSVETTLLYGLLTSARSRAWRHLDPYAGVTIGAYRRVIEQNIWVTLHSIHSSGGEVGFVPLEQTGARARPMVVLQPYLRIFILPVV